MPEKASSNTRRSIIISRGEFLAPREDTTDFVEPVGLEEPQVRDAGEGQDVDRSPIGKMVAFGLFASNVRDGK
jgi:hypothetical protein